MKNDSTREIGRFGEQVICNYLIQNGCAILERNFMTRHGEIDIIAEDEQYIMFIEVKTRSETKFLQKYGRPANAVNKDKWQHITYAANTYLRQYKPTKMLRLDVAEIYLTPIPNIENDTEFISARINYIKSAYRR
jgi:Predicted endonuclease distantly related to archaeal Holliday junction resolvase